MNPPTPLRQRPPHPRPDRRRDDGKRRDYRRAVVPHTVIGRQSASYSSSVTMSDRAQAQVRSSRQCTVLCQPSLPRPRRNDRTRDKLIATSNAATAAANAHLDRASVVPCLEQLERYHFSYVFLLFLFVKKNRDIVSNRFESMNDIRLSLTGQGFFVYPTTPRWPRRPPPSAPPPRPAAPPPASRPRTSPGVCGPGTTVSPPPPRL